MSDLPDSPDLHLPSLSLRALLVLCALAVVSLLYLPLPILPALAQSYGMGTAAASSAIGAFGLAYATGFLIFGPLSDRFGRRPVMVWGLMALALSTVALVFVRTAPWLLAGRVLQGFAAASFPPVVIAYLAERGSPPQRTWAVAWMSTAFLCAGLLGQMYGLWVAGRWGLGLALLPLALIYVLTALALLAGTPRQALAASPRAWWAGYRLLGSLLADARLRRVYGPAFLLLMAFVAFYMGLDAHAGAAMRAQGITLLAARGLALPAFLAPLAVALVMPRWGAQRVVTAGLFTATAGLVLSALAGDAHLYGLLAASVLFVAGVGMSVPGLIARVASVADAQVRGLAVAFYTFVLFVGASLGPLLAAQTARWTPRGSFGLLAAWMAIAAIYARAGRKSRASEQGGPGQVDF